MKKIKILSTVLLITLFSFFNISNAKSETLRVSDVLLDIGILKNKEVNVKGFFMGLGTLAYIYEEQGSMNFIMVETKNAPRDDRKYLLKNCEGFGGCNITLNGKLSESFGLITLNLNRIIK